MIEMEIKYLELTEEGKIRKVVGTGKAKEFKHILFLTLDTERRKYLC